MARGTAERDRRSALGGITPAGREVPETACREERGPDVPPGVADGCDHFREQPIKPITVV
ncbi:hypothetical protein [Streptosporangium sp. NPDC000509]|uniref:hypothetical protein n=1 Tax=Streptosporangium sp. NPDC000509 TaxID=3366186 RepID=UPI0036B96D6A